MAKKIGTPYSCADVVERFQLWLMLLIIAMRNIVEVGGLSILSSESSSSWTNAFGGISNSSAPFSASSIIPLSFTIFPKWIGQVLNPFLLVLGSEMLVDWLKHAYINKFNALSPKVYGRYLDILAKDYYTGAFSSPFSGLVRRVGLPVIPLACLFIRATLQTYHMFLDTHLPYPLPSPATSLAADPVDPSQSPATTAEMLQLPQLLRRVLGRHVPAEAPAAPLFHVPYLPFALPSNPSPPTIVGRPEISPSNSSRSPLHLHVFFRPASSLCAALPILNITVEKRAPSPAPEPGSWSEHVARTPARLAAPRPSAPSR